MGEIEKKTFSIVENKAFSIIEKKSFFRKGFICCESGRGRLL
jgi:hypothetical protein